MPPSIDRPLCCALVAATSLPCCLLYMPARHPGRYHSLYSSLAVMHIVLLHVLLPAREAYNAKLAAGTHVVLTEEAAAYEASQGLEPVDYVALYNKHKDAIAAATEAKVSCHHSPLVKCSTPLCLCTCPATACALCECGLPGDCSVWDDLRQ